MHKKTNENFDVKTILNITKKLHCTSGFPSFLPQYPHRGHEEKLNWFLTKNKPLQGPDGLQSPSKPFNGAGPAKAEWNWVKRTV